MADGVVSAWASQRDGADAPANWRLDDARPEVSFGWDYRDDWRLNTAPTAYLRIAGPDRQRASLKLAAEDGGDWRVRPLHRYELRLHSGVHRGLGQIRLTVLDADGVERQVLTDTVAPRFRGGTARVDYHCTHISFVAPPDAWAVRIEGVLAPRDDGDDRPDQFLFLALPEWRETAADPGVPLWAIHDARLFVAMPGPERDDLVLRVGKARFSIAPVRGGAYAEIDLPTDVLDGRRHGLSLWARDEEVWADWPVIPTPADGGFWRRRIEDADREASRAKRQIQALQDRIAVLEPAAAALARRVLDGEDGKETSSKDDPRRPRMAPSFAPIGPAGDDDPRLPAINWVIGPPLNDGWAYGNNARRIASQLPSWRHRLTSDGPAEVVVYFDALLARGTPRPGGASILRVGGDRPLDRCFGDDPEAMREGLSRFDAVIALSPALLRRIGQSHANAVFIPNGLDLAVWRPQARTPDPGRPFTAGFAASVKSPAEQDQKGLDLAVSACAAAGVPLRRLHKGEGQISHDRMIADFYSRIDVLVHPVAAGREGTSNVIMEAAALGLPVILTPDAGFHGEAMIDGRDGLLVGRDVEQIAEALGRLRDDHDLRGGVGLGARAFAEAHHDLGRIAEQYEALFRDAALGRRLMRTPDVGFHPFWRPTEQFASSRLRSSLPTALMSGSLETVREAETHDVRDVAVVIQSAEDGLMQALTTRPDTAVIYDVCDRYFENDRVLAAPSGEVRSLARFHQLAERADLLIAPTLALKGELAMRFPGKPVHVMPEMKDYGWPSRPATLPGRGALWFGSPQRGNFQAARWMLDHLRTLGFDLTLVSKARKLAGLADARDRIADWSAPELHSALAETALCVVAHAPEEAGKSANRLVTAVTAGVPTLVCEAPASEALLREAGCDYAIVRSPETLEAAVRRLDDPAERRDYIARVQAVIERRHGDAVVRQTYLDLFTRRIPARLARPLRVAFVGGLDDGGGGDAVPALIDLVVGLRAKGAIDPVVLTVPKRVLGAACKAAGIAVLPIAAPIHQAFAPMRTAFATVLADRGIDVVVADGPTAAPFVEVAALRQTPAVMILRDRATSFAGLCAPARAAARDAMLEARTLVFTSRQAEAAWRSQPRTLDVRVIRDGVSLDRFRPWLDMAKADARRIAGIDTPLVALSIGPSDGQGRLADWYADLPLDLRDQLTLLFVGADEAVRSCLPPDAARRVTIVPATPDRGLYYRAADVLLFDADASTPSRVVSEALGFGLPILSASCPGLDEQVEHGVNGLVHPPGDAAAWRAAITRLMTDEADRARLSLGAEQSFWRQPTHAEMLNDVLTAIAPRHPRVEAAVPTQADQARCASSQTRSKVPGS